MDRIRDRNRRAWTSASLALFTAALGCGPGGKAAAPGSTEAKGVYGSTYLVAVARPVHGTIRSGDGQIACGSAPAATACSGSYGWNVPATLTATPDAGYLFQNWAGDCQYEPCVLSTVPSGADKYVVAVFATPDQLGHPNWTSQRLHGPAYLDFLAGVPDRPRCTNCHGATLSGRGIAPGCQGCHEQKGWADWRSNCSFCHGARTALTQAGYDQAAHPEWAAPPDAVSQRLTGTAAPAQTGAHQAHLTGAASDGMTFYAAPFKCETCHAVPTDLSHVKGSTARAQVRLRGAGQASLPDDLGTYDPASGTCTTYCHGSTLVDADGRPMPPQGWSSFWQPTGFEAVPWHCGTCHGGVVGIPSGYIPVTGLWVLVLGPGTGRHRTHNTLGCYECHYATADEYYDVTQADRIANRANHVNGVKDVLVRSEGNWNTDTGQCTTACHAWLTKQWR